MSAGPKTVQNFRAFRACVVTDSDVTFETLQRVLTKLGVEGCSRLDASPELGVFSLARIPSDKTVLFVDGDLDIRFDPPVEGADGLPVVPVVGLVGMEAPSRLKALSRMGATALLRKPVPGAAIYSAVFFAVNQFNRLRHLTDLVDGHEQRRRSRMFVVKGILARMRARGVSEDAAYEGLRREAMAARMTIEDYCATLRLRDKYPLSRYQGAANVSCEWIPETHAALVASACRPRVR